jgi:hypothetical protein
MQIAARKAAAASGRPQDSSSHARKAVAETMRVLNTLVTKWDVVAATVLVGSARDGGGLGSSSTPPPVGVEEMDVDAVEPTTTATTDDGDGESGNVAQLDGLVFRLLSSDLDGVLAAMLRTMQTALSSSEDAPGVEAVVARFVQSATRVYSVLVSGPVATDATVEAVVAGPSVSISRMGGSVSLRRADGGGGGGGNGSDAVRVDAEYSHDAPLLVQCR